MSAAVMSNFYFPPMNNDGHGHVADSQARVQNWMLAQMAHYPSPSAADQHHYNALYPAVTSAGQPLVDAQDHLQYSSINTPLYPKPESISEQGASSQQINSLAQDLRQHTTLGDQHFAHAAHQVSQHTSHPGSSHLPHIPQGPAQHDTPESSQKPNRLRKACDSCSIRKVKCDESGPPCRACTALDIPCTFDRPSRRRGPPNRHAEAIKRRRLEEQTGGSPHLSATSAPSSPTHAAQALAALSSQTSNAQLSAESICPAEILDLLIDDFFTYIHPLCPFPHEPSFREAWKRREDLSNNSFLALLASMVGALVASFPRRPRLRLMAQKREKLYPNHVTLVLRCQKVATSARGSAYLESETLNVYDAATSYFLALAGFYTFRWRPGRLYLGECLTIIRTLGIHKTQDLDNTRPNVPLQPVNNPSGIESPAVDNITREIGRRIFWTVFVSIRSMQQLGAASNEFMVPPPTPTDPYPPLPAEVDDFCIYPSHTEQQPHGLIPRITGFIANVHVYCSYNSLSTMELAWGIDAVVDWERQKRVLYESLRRCKESLSQLPSELAVHSHTGERIGADQNSPSGFATHLAKSSAPQGMNALQPTENLQDPARRRQAQLEIQKANIYASCLSTRSYIVEKYWSLCEAHERSKSPPKPSSPTSGVMASGLDGLVSRPPTSNPDLVEQTMRLERESIIKDLLAVLTEIDIVNMEPNADSFNMKIRAIAGTLLDEPNERKGQIPAEAQNYLNAFLKVLLRLERVSPANSESDEAQDDESDLRTWADLREYQAEFARSGGVLALS